MTTQIIIESFHPLRLTLPPGTEVSGPIRIVLPPIHVQVVDLSMGIRELKGAHIGGDVPIVGLDIEFPEPVETSKLMAFIVETQDTLKKAWKLYQAEFDRRGALLG